MHISKLVRTEPESQIFYRLKYRAELRQSEQNCKTTEVFFVVELDPLGRKSVYWDLEPEGLSASEREQALELLRDFADHDKLPH